MNYVEKNSEVLFIKHFYFNLNNEIKLGNIDLSKIKSIIVDIQSNSYFKDRNDEKAFLEFFGDDMFENKEKLINIRHLSIKRYFILERIFNIISKLPNNKLDSIDYFYSFTNGSNCIFYKNITKIRAINERNVFNALSYSVEDLLYFLISLKKWQHLKYLEFDFAIDNKTLQELHHFLFFTKDKLEKLKQLKNLNSLKINFIYTSDQVISDEKIKNIHNILKIFVGKNISYLEISLKNQNQGLINPILEISKIKNITQLIEKEMEHLFDFNIQTVYPMELSYASRRYLQKMQHLFLNREKLLLILQAMITRYEKINMRPEIKTDTVLGLLGCDVNNDFRNNIVKILKETKLQTSDATKKKEITQEKIKPEEKKNKDPSSDEYSAISDEYDFNEENIIVGDLSENPFKIFEINKLA